MPDIELIRRRLIRDARAHEERATNASVGSGSQVPQGLVQRAKANPHSLQTIDLLYLQRTIGNGAVNRMLGKGSSSLTVGASDDRFEQEANRISDQVSAPGLRSSVQRSASGSEIGAEGGVVSRDLESRIKSAKGGGSPAPEGVCRAMEEKTGADFGSVRVHDDKEANSISAQLGAKAATYGRDIFLARDQSPHDVQLMSHELTHTVQQGAVKAAGEHTPVQDSGSMTPTIQRKPSKFDKWVARNKSGPKQDDHERKRIAQLEELTDEQLTKSEIDKKVGRYALQVFQEILLLPVTIIDQLTVLDLHLKDFFNYVRTGKTRGNKTDNYKNAFARKDKSRRKKHFKREMKRLKRENKERIENGEEPKTWHTGEDFNKFQTKTSHMNTRTEVGKGVFKRKVGRSGLRGYLTGLNSHKYMYGGAPNPRMKGGLNSELNPIKHVAWGIMDLKGEQTLHEKERDRRAKHRLEQEKQERAKRAGIVLDPNDNDVQDDNVQDNTVQDNNVQSVNGQVDDLNENEIGVQEEGNDMSDSDLELIQMLDDVMAQIDQKNKEYESDRS